MFIIPLPITLCGDIGKGNLCGRNPSFEPSESAYINGFKENAKELP